MSQQRRINPFSPVPSLAAANQNQIEDLVQRNKTLDATQKKLVEEARQERERHRAELLRTKAEQGRLEEDCRKGCYDILAICRISQGGVQLELEAERARVIQEMRICREEKLERMKRDYKIKLFQMRDEELEQQINQLEEEKRWMELEHGEETEQLRGDYNELRGKLKDALDELKQAKKNKEALQVKFDKLTEEFATHHAGNSTLTTKLERLRLQLEGAHTKNADLERTNDELKRASVQLQRQVDDWQNLERREGDEIDTERKQRVAVSVELNKLQALLKADTERFEASLEKERQKVEKWRAAVDQWQDTSNENEKELHASRKEANKLQKQVNQLKADLEAERERASPERAVSTLKGKAGSKRRADDSEVEEDEPPPKSAKVPRKASDKTKPTPAEPSDEEEDIVIPEDSEHEEEVVEVKKVGPPKGKRKRSDLQVEPKPKRGKVQAKEKKPASTIMDKNDSPKPQAGKKKRKINKFFPGNTGPFDLNAMNFGVAGGLDIPSILSPVREGDAIPPRSESHRRSNLR